jgi:hypothetical protein
MIASSSGNAEETRIEDILRLQWTINCTQDFCEEWKLKINVGKTKLVVFKKGGELIRMKNGDWEQRKQK